MSANQVTEITGDTTNIGRKYLQKLDGKKMTHFECVGQFHDTFGHPQRQEPYVDCFDEEPKLVPFRISLMEEELNEFKDALKNNDLVEMADALCDLSYVINGAGHCLGINIDNILEVCKLNTHTPKKLDMSVNKNIVKEKPEMINKGMELIEKHLKDFCKYSTKKYWMEMKLSLVNMLEATYRLGHHMNFNMDAMFREVHRSNMTKVCSNIEDAKESIKRYEEEKRYAKPSMKIKGPYYVIYDASTSKILKNYKWETPNIKQFM